MHTPFQRRVGSHIGPFEAGSAFTHVAACWLVAPPRGRICLEGFDGLVTSTATPIASGRSVRVGRAGLALAGIHCLFTAHAAKPDLRKDPMLQMMGELVVLRVFGTHDIVQGHVAVWLLEP
jgi:hypothetical protein